MSRKKMRKNKTTKQLNSKKISLVIIFFLIMLILIIALKLAKNPREENINSINNSEEINMQINENEIPDKQLYYSLEKDEIKNIIKIMFTIKSDIGIKKIELPDGSLHQYDSEKEIKIEYVIDRNGEYVISVTETNDNVMKKSIRITAISN